jgi:Subtilase family
VRSGTPPTFASLRALAIVAVVGATIIAQTSVASGARQSGGGDLSSRLAELAKPAVRSASPARQAQELGLPADGPGSLLRDGDRVLVEVRFDRGAVAGVDDLRAAGAHTIDVSARYQTVTAEVLPRDLDALSPIPGVAAVTEVLAPVASESTCPAGSVVSEGDLHLRAAEARQEFVVDGSGVEVGILSDSFDQDKSAETSATDDVKSGDLPGSFNTCPGQSTPVDVRSDFNDPEAADEGRAMSQIVHDLAPGAQLSFATAFTGVTAFANSIEDLAATGADVIADDVAYFEEPFFQEGPVGVAVSNVTDAGVAYFSSAGNNNLIDISTGKEIASWEAPAYRDSLACPAALVALSETLEGLGEGGLEPEHCMDFDPSAGVDRTFGIEVENEDTLSVDLQWAEPWEGVATDIDAFLIGPSGTIATGSVDDNVFDSQRPFEFLSWENDSGADAQVRLVINRYDGASPRLKFALLQNGGGVTSTEYESSAGGDVVGPTIFGHNGSEDAISAGAIHRNSLTAPEPYSSRGPVIHYFAPVDGATPALPLSTRAVLSKPDLVATDCGKTTFFVPTETAGLFRFCGTSAAAPHAAAIAALMLEKDPAASPADVRTAIEGSAAPVGSFGPCAVGAGRVDAVAAMELLLDPEPRSLAPCTPPVSFPIVDQGGTVPPEIPVSPVANVPIPFPEPTPRATRQKTPSTFFRQRPPKTLSTEGRLAKAIFRFGSNDADAVFLCRLDRRPFRECRRRVVRRLAPGSHVMRVKARDSEGRTDRTPAVYRFRVVPAR